ncbi:MAG TPA: hypothetical protein VNJ28_07450, partial [Candidatus Limnocylindrales bacterium]|nr:hypothetical protein [Candidatus Limnocylindrales bacterium]
SSERASTQVVVVGLMSVASIAGFKRAVSRIPGVQAVAVSSGPNGEFVYAVDHTPGLDLAGAITGLPGFEARITGAGEGVLAVTARDPEA